MEFSYVAIAAIAMPLFVQLAKKLVPKVPPRYLSIGFCMVAGLVYALTNSFVPAQIVESFTLVAGITFTVGTGIYQIQK